MKKCTRCKEIKELTEFTILKTKKDGYNSRCKQCTKVYMDLRKERTKMLYLLRKLENPESYVTKIKISKKKYYEKNKDSINKYHANKYIQNMQNEDFKKQNKIKAAISRDKNRSEIRRKYQENKKSIEYVTDVKNKKQLYYEKNKEYIKNKAREYSKENRGICNSIKARRNSAKILATPKWLTFEHFEEIKRIYELAKELEIQDGIKRHVDHIIPLRGKLVSGLHVPWNLQILEASENIRKGNRI